MANKKIVYSTSGGLTLVAGMDWQLLSASKKTDAAVREKARVKGGTHFVTCRALEPEEVQTGNKVRQIHRVTAGIAQTLGGKDNFGKKPHSVAAAFALWAKDCPKAALFAVVDEERVVVVVSINGMPVLDAIIADRAEARMRLAGFLSDHPDMTVFANDAEQYPNDFWDDLWGNIAATASASTAIKPIPVDVVKIAAIALFVALAGGGWYGWQDYQERKRQAELEAEAARNNPETLYLNALAAVQGYGIDRDSVLGAFQTIYPLPASVNGWVASEVVCGESSCQMVVNRTHGTFDMLRSGIAHLPLQIVPNQDEINLTRVVTTWTPSLQQAAYPESARTATVNDFISSDGSQFQEWMLAGLSLRIDAPALYPEVPGVPPNFTHPQAVRRGVFEVSGVSLPLVQQLISSAPSNIVFTGFKLALAPEGDEALAKANATITGYYYVNQ